MQRTRKFQHLSHDAKRLAELGLSPTAIAEQLGLNRSTVQRWMAAGQIHDTRAPREGETPSPIALVADVAAAEWAAAIRAAYTLDATDSELVTLADAALTLAQNATEIASVRLAAMGRFQSLVKQLATRIRPVAEDQAAVPARVATARADPRALLSPTLQ